SPYFFFFFQAEDGIRYPLVTGVQTCALPICLPEPTLRPVVLDGHDPAGLGGGGRERSAVDRLQRVAVDHPRRDPVTAQRLRRLEIGRASCRERVWVSGCAGAREKNEHRDSAT